MNTPLGKKKWVIPEGYIPGWSHGDSPDLESHDALLILNTSNKTAHVEIYIYFEDKDPVGPYSVIINPIRTKHLLVNDFTSPQPIPRETAYSSVISSDTPVVVEYTRLDSRQAENALLTTIAYPVEERKSNG